jgi:hypothetical protein
VAKKNIKEVKMSKKKLQLNKITIQKFENQLVGDEQKTAKGGSINNQVRTTVTPVFCPPYPNS